MTDIKQTDFDAFTSHTLDVTNSLVEIREVSDDEIREAMREAAKATSYPIGTVALMPTIEAWNGIGRPFPGPICATVDVEAAVQLDNDIVRDVREELTHRYGSSALTSREPSEKGWTECAVYLLPRRDFGYQAQDTDVAVAYGERIGTLYEPRP